MDHIIKFHKNKTIELTIPNNNNKVVLVNLLNIENGVDVFCGDKVTVITLSILNKNDFRYFTEKMFHFFVKKEIKKHLSLFSINNDLVLNFL